MLRQEGKTERLEGMQEGKKAGRKGFVLEMIKRPLQQHVDTLSRCIHIPYNLTSDFNKSVLSASCVKKLIRRLIYDNIS